MPSGYDYNAVDINISGPDVDGTGSEVGASVVLAWSSLPEAVGEVLAQRQADARQAEEDSRKPAPVPTLSDPVIGELC